MARLDSKIAIITGASSGIGRQIALEFHRQGAVVICADINDVSRNDLEADRELPTHALIRKQGGRAEFVPTDVTQPDDVEGLVDFAHGEQCRGLRGGGVAGAAGDLGVLAGRLGKRPGGERDGRVPGLQVCGGADDSTGAFALWRPGLDREHGLDPVWGIGVDCFLAGYAASKHACLGVTKVAAQDCAPYRVHVNALCPGFTDTALISYMGPEFLEAIAKEHPFRGLGKPEDIAKATVFLASEDNTWITGVALPVDGGFTIK
ncbi:hypothetical protein BP5796_05050 [Coleophoma crateriformis]|uniref:Uncharacterized protein n=1 Tax=Coleophoma crateriformis TaxID=565419 RepID=A0A3D8S222_9HELO|nr:hypothetical protein BP5796_05050 [Coleophoma crateriformis]